MSDPESSPHKNNNTNDCELMYDNINFDPSDPRQVLKELAKRASRYSINLDGSVSNDYVSCSEGGHAVVYLGILKLNKTEAAGTVSSASLGDGKTMKVDLPLNHIPYF